MNQKETRYLIGGIVILAVVAFAATLYVNRPKSGITPVSGADLGASTTMTRLSSTTVLVSSPSGSYTITQDSATDLPSAPDFSTPISCSSDLSADTCAALKAQQSTVIALLKKNNTDYSAWLDLGRLRKETGDYSGAATAWTYLTKLYPGTPLAFNNLGDLYMNFLKDYPKAEASWKQAIALKADNPAPYEDLFTLYSATSYKPSNSAAENILKQGITANPKAVNLQIDLARYYRANGNTDQANATYDAAIANAQAQGQAQLATQIQQEKGGQQ